MEALARRAAAQAGQARRLLDARLAVLMAECGQPGAADGPVAAAPAARPQGALGALARELARGHGEAAPEGAALAQRELHTLRRFRATWTRLSAEERLRQAGFRCRAEDVPARTGKRGGSMHTLFVAWPKGGADPPRSEGPAHAG